MYEIRSDSNSLGVNVEHVRRPDLRTCLMGMLHGGACARRVVRSENVAHEVVRIDQAVAVERHLQ